MSTEQLTSAALALPLADRVSLAQMLWRSIDEDLPESAHHPVLAEAARRDEELSAGVAEGRPHEEVMRAARRAIGCA